MVLPSGETAGGILVECDVVFADCSIGCDACGECLGCLRKLIFNPGDGTFDFSEPEAMCWDGEHHRPIHHLNG